MLTLCSILLMLTGLIFAKPISHAVWCRPWEFWLCLSLSDDSSARNVSVHESRDRAWILYQRPGDMRPPVWSGGDRWLLFATWSLIRSLLFCVRCMGIRGWITTVKILHRFCRLLSLHFCSSKENKAFSLLHRVSQTRASQNMRKKYHHQPRTAGFIMQLTNSLVPICCNHVLSVTGGTPYILSATIISSVRQLRLRHHQSMQSWKVLFPLSNYNYGSFTVTKRKQAAATMGIRGTHFIHRWYFVFQIILWPEFLGSVFPAPI